MNLVVFIWELLVNLLGAVWEIVFSLLNFALSSAHWLHLEAPRLEGLLVGVLLAWLYVRRDRHPLLKSLGAPMKLILDVLDAVWDNVGDFMGGIKDTVFGWIQSGYGWLRERVTRTWGVMLGTLSSIRDRLRNRSSK
jgi:hypothetical protein